MPTSSNYFLVESEVDKKEDKDEEESTVYCQLNEDFDNTAFNKGDSKKTKSNLSRSHNDFFPASMMFFMLCRLCGVGIHNFDITSALTMDTKNLENNARSSKQMNTKSMKQSQKEESTYTR